MSEQLLTRARMLRVRGALAAGVCGALLGACGSAKTSHQAAINAALRQLQAEFEHVRPARGKELLGTITLHASSPKGVSSAEWQAAMNKDKALQRAILASK